MITGWIDRFGSVASAVCAIHCLLLSLAPWLISALGLGVLANESFEWAFFVFAVGFALAAAWWGYRLHRTWWVLTGFSGGLLLLIAGRMGEALSLYEGGGIVSVLGGGVLVISHILSMRQARVIQEAYCP